MYERPYHKPVFPPYSTYSEDNDWQQNNPDIHPDDDIKDLADLPTGFWSSDAGGDVAGILWLCIYLAVIAGIAAFLVWLF